MKKILLVGTLVLTIVTSMVAGTLATYTKTLEPIEGEVTAKQFFIGASTSSFADVKLAPTESDEWSFDVVNTQSGEVTETDMDLKIDVTVTGSIDGLKVSLLNGSNAVIGSGVVTKSGTISFEEDKAFLANVAATKSFKIKVLWENGVATDATDTANADANATADISVTVTGTQDIA